MKNLGGKKAFVGLSGGVDSAVTAALLARAGLDVYGIFIKGWYPPGLPCTWAADRRDAMRVAAHLGIPFHTLDGSEAYKRSVIDYLIREYRAGRTPNPDVMCNRDVKFGVFHEFAKKNNADYIATGHYARLEEGKLLRGVDPEKDQSYFLWAVNPAALAMTLFPLGGMLKSDVRVLAERLSLPNARKRDSQGICFLGPVSMDDFLVAEFGESVGEAVDEAGAHIGTHNGVLLHTLGERIMLTDATAGPWYVVGKDVPANRLVVAKEKKRSDRSAGLTFSDANWFREPGDGEYTMQYRYHGPRVPGTIRGNAFHPRKTIGEPIAGGQSLVFYSNDELIGGAIVN